MKPAKRIRIATLLRGMKYSARLSVSERRGRSMLRAAINFIDPMPTRAPENSMSAKLSSLQTAVTALHATAPVAQAIARLTFEVEAARFHLMRDLSKDRPAIIAVLGGTGTGKSTLVNLLLDARDHPITAASFRRTFTAGP